MSIYCPALLGGSKSKIFALNQKLILDRKRGVKMSVSLFFEFKVTALP